MSLRFGYLKMLLLPGKNLSCILKQAGSKSQSSKDPGLQTQTNRPQLADCFDS